MSRSINFRVVFKVVSRNSFIIAVALLLCAALSIFLSESFWPFIFSSLIAFLIGMASYLFYGKKSSEKETLQRKDAYLTVTLSWLLISLVGCLPYVFSGAIPSFVDAFFESVSGFTTTGSSILSDIEALPKSILFWRSLTHWIGGLGIIVLVIVVMPTLRMGGYHLFILESSLQEKIRPRIRDVGTRLIVIYLMLSIGQTILLLLGGMNLFESVCHTFGTVATGGFSPKNDSIAGYSPYIQYVIMIFMLLAGTNFVVHYYLLKRQLGKISKNEEFKFYYLVVFLIGAVIMSVLIFEGHKPFEEAFREGFFQVISIITTTGYITTDYLQWPVYAWMILFLAMFLGASTGSTGGGVKMVRYLILYKNISRVFRQLISPNAVIPLRLNKKTISEESNHSILAFISTYFLIFIIGSIFLVIIGIDWQTAGGSVVACMGAIGPGIGTVGPASNFGHLPDIAKLILSGLMLIGRLEVYTVLVLFTRNFWMK